SAKAIPSRARVARAWVGRMPVKVRRTKVVTILSTPGKSRGGNGPYMANACQSTATVMNGAAAPASEAMARRSAAAAPTLYTSWRLHLIAAKRPPERHGLSVRADSRSPSETCQPAGRRCYDSRPGEHHGTERRVGKEHAAAGAHGDGRLRQLRRRHGHPARA